MRSEISDLIDWLEDEWGVTQWPWFGPISAWSADWERDAGNGSRIGNCNCEMEIVGLEIWRMGEIEGGDRRFDGLEVGSLGFG